MDSDLSDLMWRVYRGYRTDIDGSLDALNLEAGDEDDAADALEALVVDVRAKRPDDGLSRTAAVLSDIEQTE